MEAIVLQKTHFIPGNIFTLMQYLYYTRDIFFDKLAICRQTRASCKPRFMEAVSGDVPRMSPFDRAPFFPNCYP